MDGPRCGGGIAISARSLKSEDTGKGDEGAGSWQIHRTADVTAIRSVSSVGFLALCRAWADAVASVFVSEAVTPWGSFSKADNRNQNISRKGAKTQRELCVTDFSWPPGRRESCRTETGASRKHRFPSWSLGTRERLELGNQRETPEHRTLKPLSHAFLAFSDRKPGDKVPMATWRRR